MSDVRGAAPQPRTETTQEAHDIWRVQLATGEIRAMTLEALDAAFEDGLIDERTPVLPPFAPTWSTLGIVAGLEVEDTQPDLTPSLSPVALSSPPPAEAMPNDRSRQLTGALMAPELDLDLPEAAELRPRRGLVIGVVATSIVGLVALPVAITTIASSPAIEATSVAAQLPPPVPSPLPSPKSAAPPPKEEAPTLTPHQLLDEDQKKSLADAEKARKAAAEKAVAEKAADKPPVEKSTVEKSPAPSPPPKRKAEKAPPALLNGGDRFDPLNGAL